MRHIPNKDFTPLIERAQQLPGFTSADVKAAERGDSVAVIAGHNTGRRSVTVGFGHAAVLNVAGDVIKAIEDKRLQHIFLIGGCDGNEPPESARLLQPAVQVHAPGDAHPDHGLRQVPHCEYV